MANKFTNFLNGAVTGLLTPKGQMANFQHATRLFVDDTYRLAPRTKFMFYVRFEIDKTVLTSQVFTNRHVDEIGFLVRSSDLPKYTFDSVTKNQYNRKKVVYKNISYDPLTLTFFDDNAGIINALWALYMGYYVADRTLPEQAFSKTNYRKTDTGLDNFRYGFDNNRSVDFIKSISVYTMSRRRFNGYTLINPKITQWQHGNVAYASASEPLETTMTVQYESVVYSGGNVTFDTPKGFATLHYDTTPSPLTVAGGGVANLLGDGGVLDGLEQVFGNVSNGTAFGSIGGFLSTAILAANTATNFKNLSTASLKAEAINILSNPKSISTIANTVGGVVGAVFPTNSSASNTTVASPKVLTNAQNINQ